MRLQKYKTITEVKNVNNIIKMSICNMIQNVLDQTVDKNKTENLK